MENRDTVTEEYDALVNSNSYSTTEKIIGTWIDGSTIYSKVFDLGYSYAINASGTVISSDYIPIDMYMPINSCYMF